MTNFKRIECVEGKCKPFKKLNFPRGKAEGQYGMQSPSVVITMVGSSSPTQHLLTPWSRDWECGIWWREIRCQLVCACTSITGVRLVYSIALINLASGWVCLNQTGQCLVEAYHRYMHWISSSSRWHIGEPFNWSAGFDNFEADMFGQLFPTIATWTRQRLALYSSGHIFARKLDW